MGEKPSFIASSLISTTYKYKARMLAIEKVFFSENPPYTFQVANWLKKIDC